MVEVETVRTPGGLREFVTLPSPDPLTEEDVRARDPQANLAARDADGTVRARCSVWWKETPALEGRNVAVVGHYAAATQASGRAVLEAACDAAREAGVQRVVGPMDGSTWRRYRLVTEPGTEPPFFLEPRNPESWPAHWTDVGFVPLASYVSTLTPRPEGHDTDVADWTDAARAADVSLRPIDLDDFHGELERIYGLSLRSFSGNLLYTPIGTDEFMAQYGAVRPYLDPRLVWIAERGDELVGFSFALPDLLQRQRGVPMDTAVLKTLAVDPAASGRGLGGLLTARTMAACWDAGFTRVIGALMHIENRSRRISRRYGPVIRGYTLYVRAAEP